MSLRRTARAVFVAYAEHDVLTYATALAFKIALIPLALGALGLLGLFHLEESWRTDLAPEVRKGLSPAAFRVLDDTVRQVLGRRQLFWGTLGLVLALWEISGATRGVMGVLDRIYRIRRERPVAERLAVSLALAGAAMVLGLGASWSSAPTGWASGACCCAG